jgi:hypothetical protein
MTDDAAQADQQEAAGATLEYPGPVLRPTPSFRIDLPDGWQIIEAPGSMFEMIPGGDTGLPASIITLRHSRVHPSTSFESIAADTWQQLGEAFPGIEVVDERLISAGCVQYMRESALPAVGEQAAVTRVDSFAFGLTIDQPSVDLFQFVCMLPSASHDELMPLMAEVLSSFRFA